VRSGLGIDTHRFAAGRRLILGGVEIPHTHGLDGHSDADVLAHAITDAILGAASMGDIGTHFPDTDERWRGADSLELLSQVSVFLEEHGWSVSHVDATVIAEAPKLGPYRDEMRRALAGTIGIGARDVNVKFTTNEGMGAIGRGEGIAAMAVATVER
jgi:2-C-methyl-D-erythritol 2,4-cyclodiphosphate synthase